MAVAKDEPCHAGLPSSIAVRIAFRRRAGVAPSTASSSADHRDVEGALSDIKHHRLRRVGEIGDDRRVNLSRVATLATLGVTIQGAALFAVVMTLTPGSLAHGT
ncbi:hypothetical protein GCM10008965_26080 [Methylorubrum aminovorans]|nr:hypothetical protein GCM10025880_04430 [Methylorubrum aminovorans]